MPKALQNYFLLLVCSVVQVVVHSDTCDVPPVSYRYRTGSIITTEASSSCSSNSGQNFLTCSQSTISNGDKGPVSFSDASASDYYEWNSTGGQIEFTFSQNISFTKVIVYFYVHRDPNLALPKLRLLGRDGYGFPECGTKSTSGIIDRSIDLLTLQNNPSLGRHMKEMNLAGTSNALLLCILPAKNYNLALTEIQFCTNDTISVTTSPTSASQGGVSQYNEHTTHLPTTSEPDVGARRNNNIPVGIPVGVVLGVVFVVFVVLIVLIVVWRCKQLRVHKCNGHSDSKGMITSFST